MSSVIAPLDQDTSQFTTMLMKLGSAVGEGASIRPSHHDSRLWGEWDWTSEYEQRRDEALARFEKQMRPQTVIHWMEDELFPSVGRIIQSGDPFFHKGDIVRVVGNS